MRPRQLRTYVLGPLVLAAAAFVAFAAAPVSASQPGDNMPWGDITSVVAGPGLYGGATQGDAKVSIAFGGNGSANTVARSDHNHDDKYLSKDANFDDRYLPRNANFDDRYAQVGHNHDGQYLPVDANFDDRYALLSHNHDTLYAALNHIHDDLYAALNHNHDDRYSLLGHNHDDAYAALGHNHDDRYSLLGHNHDDLYLGLGGGMLSGALQIASGNLTLTDAGGRVVAPRYVAYTPDGTAPFQVVSRTAVENLNSDLLDGHDASEFALASQIPPTGNYATLDGANAFSNANTFNSSATFAGPLSMVTGGASFTWQPVWSGTTSYSLRLIDSRLSSTRLVLDQLGRVGIGTTSPVSPLHVVGDIRASGLNLGTGVLSPFTYDMNSSSDRTFSILNSNGGVAHLSVEGNVSAAGYSVTTGGSSARAGSASITAGNTSVTVATTAVGASSLAFVTPDASNSGCVVPAGPLYVSARSAGASFTVTVGGAAPGSGQSFCFSWWLLN